MERFNIFDIRYIDLHFQKSREIAPIGYRFIGNIPVEEKERIKRALHNGDVLLPEAYDLWGELIEGCVAQYRSIIKLL